MDHICFICYDDGFTLLDPHWKLGAPSKPKHVFHAGCFASWERASKGPDTRCPYCTDSVSPVSLNYIRAAERKSVINSIRSRNLELFKSLLSDHDKLDDDSRHVYLTEATIAAEISFLEYIEEKYSLPYRHLAPFLAITLSMRNRTLYNLYWKAYDSRRLYYIASDRRHDFDCQVLVASDMAKKKWLNRWLLFRTFFRSESAKFLNGNSKIYATKFGRSPSTLKRAVKCGFSISEEDFNEHILPQIVVDETGWKQAFWFRNCDYIRLNEFGLIALKLAIAVANFNGVRFSLRATAQKDLALMKGKFKTSDIGHLFSFKGRTSGHQIFELLCNNRLVDLKDLKKNKIYLCRMCYQASNDNLAKYFLSILRESLTFREIEDIRTISYINCDHMYLAALPCMGKSVSRPGRKNLKAA